MDQQLCLVIISQTTEVYYVPFKDGSESKRAQAQMAHPSLIPALFAELAIEFKWMTGHKHSDKQYVSFVRTIVCK